MRDILASARPGSKPEAAEMVRPDVAAVEPHPADRAFVDFRRAEPGSQAAADALGRLFGCGFWVARRPTTRRRPR